MPTKQDFINFIQQQPYWNNIWDLSDLQNWAAGKEGSVNLDNLFNAYQQGNTVPTVNFCYAESGHNTDRPDWIAYKTGLQPEIAFLQNSIYDLTHRLQQYQANGGNDTSIISAIQKQITYMAQTLAQYQKSGQ